MAKRVLTVGCEIPGGPGEFIDFQSKASLLDADFVLFYPTLGSFVSPYSDSMLPGADPGKLQLSIFHWQKELTDVLDAGNTVFVLLSELRQLNFNTDHLLDLLDSKPKRIVTNYEVFPFPFQINSSTGDSMKLCEGQPLLREYWKHFGAESEYQVYLHDPDQFTPLVTTRQGNRVVGAVLRAGKNAGALIALPWLDLEKDDFFAKVVDDDEYETDHEWTALAKEWGNRFLNTLASIDQAVKSQGSKTPIPQWAQSDRYRTNEEITLSEELSRIQDQISKFEAKKEDTVAMITDAGSLKGLLFEQGEPLEEAVLKALRLMGFTANRYRDSASEIDAVLECAEGRCIGEVEGKDNKPINIDKFRQLMSNVHEDFGRKEVAEMAKPVLFGNAYRLTPPHERLTDHFTAKCVTAAKTNGAALVRTSDLFTVARVLSDNFNEKYAAACRNAILNTNGSEVVFPPAPSSTASGTVRNGRNIRKKSAGEVAEAKR